METLFTRVAKSIGTPGMPGVWLAGRRLVAIDRSRLDVADTAPNAAFYGRPGVSTGEKAAFGQVRLVALAECVFYSFTLWRRAIATDADLLWWAKTGLRPQHLQTLDDDTWRAQIRPSGEKTVEPITVRVIDYTVDDGRDNTESYRLFSTILDPAQASATELVAAYARRWEIDLVLDELKTHQRGPRTVLRSKSPELVLQEIWGHLCCHYAIRTLMADAAQHSGHDPDRMSFVAALGDHTASSSAPRAPRRSCFPSETG